MRVSHGFKAVFDDPNLVSCAGLAPVLALAQRAGLDALIADRLTISAPGGADPGVKISTLVAGMVAGADSIHDMDVLRHGGMDRLPKRSSHVAANHKRAPRSSGTLRNLSGGTSTVTSAGVGCECSDAN